MLYKINNLKMPLDASENEIFSEAFKRTKVREARYYQKR